MQKVKLLSFNIQGKKSKREKESIIKIAVLIKYMKENKFDIACIQETKTKQGELYETIVKYCPNAQVIECSNLDNHNKGGVAIVNINDKINISKVLLDNELDSTWSDTIPAQDDNKYQVDNVLGKFMQVSFIFNDQVHDLVNVYAPSYNSYCRDRFYRFMNSKIPNTDRMIMMGDFNNVVDPSIDIIRNFDISNHSVEDVQTFIDLLSDKQLMDTYLSLRDEFSGPMMMTNQSVSILPDGTRQVTYSRIDRAHHTPLLEGHILIDTLYTKYNNTNPIPLDSTHSPIEVTLINPTSSEIKQYNDIWRMNCSIAIQPKHKKKIIELRDIYWNKCKDKSDRKKVEEYRHFKGKVAEYLKAQQYNSNNKIKKEKESIRTQLEYNHFYDTQQKEQAMFRLQEIDSYETQGRILRCHYDQVKTAAKNSKYHSIRARKSFLTTKMSAMLTMDNQLKTDQQGIKLACVEYWSHIMRKREIDRVSMKSILNNIQYKMLLPSRRDLGRKLDQPGYMKMEDFISLDAIKESLTSMKLAKSPGPDGFPIEFYVVAGWVGQQRALATLGPCKSKIP